MKTKYDLNQAARVAPARRNIGGSLLSSSNPRILTPIDCAFGRLQVRELRELDTHGLFLTDKRGEHLLASHPNGYSCHSLAERMVSGDAKRVREQVEYILACAGMARGIEWIFDAMGASGEKGGAS